MNASDLSNRDKLVCACIYFARTVPQLYLSSSLSHKYLKVAKTKFSFDATQNGKDHCYRREQSRMNKESSSLLLSSLPLHGTYFLMRWTFPSRSKLAEAQNIDLHTNLCYTHTVCILEVKWKYRENECGSSIRKPLVNSKASSTMTKKPQSQQSCLMWVLLLKLAQF